MEIVILLLKVIFVFGLVALHLASFCTWVERKGSALIQDRIGANRALAFIETDNLMLKPVFFFVRIMGMLGIINTLVNDAVKAILKEDFLPEGVSNFMHSLAPFLAVLPIFLAYAVVPMGPNFDLGGYHITTQIATIDAGVLFLFAMGSVSVYGVAMAGWTGNNKFSLLGALRASAQMISYELAMGIAFISVIVVYGTLDLYQMVEAQRQLWGVLTQPLTFLILFVVGMAETKRGPFDLPESESELVAGYFTEYSGMKFLLFWLGEFAEIALFALLISILFFGGWHLPLIDLPGEGSWIGFLAGFVVLMAKVVFFCVLQIVIRWTLPRFRYDQLMNLGWKILLPLSLANLMLYGALKLLKVLPAGVS